MKNLVLTHGSPNKIDPKEGFQIFDYVSKNGESEISGNGNDSFGPGIYTFASDPDYSKANLYANGGYIYKLKLDVENTIDEFDPEYMSVEQWTKVVEVMVEHHRQHARYDEDEFSGLVYEVENAFEDGSHHAALEKLQDHLENIIDEPLDYNQFDIDDYEDVSEWAEAINDEYRNEADPASFIWEQVYANSNSLEDFLTKVMYRSENLWEVLTEVYNLTSVEVDGSGGFKCWNNTFKNAVLNLTRHEIEMTAAVVNDGHFVVIFDTNKIEVAKMIDLDRSQKLEMTF
ncbi:hypothetical protein [Vibrio owensii]|uniref:hypothetical protein n=1 Tax=Vibrio owensii TaxID=696485 RepID=UPI003CC5D70E